VDSLGSGFAHKMQAAHSDAVRLSLSVTEVE